MTNIFKKITLNKAFLLKKIENKTSTPIIKSLQKMENTPQQRKVIMTAAQPTGKLHLGNYLGAVKNWADMIENYECYFGIVDMHAITVPYVPADLKRNVYDCAAQYIACGLDPEKSNLFLQSMVKYDKITDSMIMG